MPFLGPCTKTVCGASTTDPAGGTGGETEVNRLPVVGPSGAVPVAILTRGFRVRIPPGRSRSRCLRAVSHGEMSLPAHYLAESDALITLATE